MKMDLKKTENNIKNSKCLHCETPINIKTAVFSEEYQGYFCCEGCFAVYKIIQEGGLSSFYEKRAGWTEGAVEQTFIDSDYFTDSLKPNKDGTITLEIVISGIRCAACVWLLESFITKDDAVKLFRINYATHKAKIIFDPNKILLGDLLNKISQLGYCPLPQSETENIYEKERKDYFYRFGAGVFFSMQVMIYSFANYAGYFHGMDKNLYFLFQLLSWLLATPVMIYSAKPFFIKALNNLKYKVFTMDTLVALGSGTAYLYSIAAIFLGYETFFDTAVTIVTLILLGRFIEAGAKQKGNNTVSKLLSLKPKKVKKILIDNNEVVIIPIENLIVGDYFALSAGEVIAADGKIIEGEYDIDESMLTGESTPIHKKAGDLVFTGTKIITGDGVALVEKTGSESFISKIVAAVENAQTYKSNIEVILDKFIGKFVPFVICISITTFIIWFFMFNLNFEVSIMRAISVLVIACPCAMGLATPLAVINSITRLSETGIIFKNIMTVEIYADAKNFYFDKTGTITKGEMSVAKSIVDEKFTELISSLAFYSNHPASKAIYNLYNINNKLKEYNEVAGQGIVGYINNNIIRIGSEQFLINNNIKINDSYKEYIYNLSSKGLTIVCASVNSECVGVFGISDTIREEAKEVIDSLINKGYNVYIITGDKEIATKNILEANNIYNVSIAANLSPFDKAEIINKDINAVMIGDGINDAIALTAADIGIAVKNSNNDISMESASGVLLRNDLRILLEAHNISKKTKKIIKENIFWAFSYNIIAIPLAITGLIHPIMGAAFMSVSSILVVINSLRIKKA